MATDSTKINAGVSKGGSPTPVKPILSKPRINPRSLQNLKKFARGQNGNAGGRPKTKDFRQFLLDWLKEKASGNKTNQLALVERLAKEKPEIIFYYAHGKPTDVLEISGNLGISVQVEDMSAEELRADMIKRGELTPEGRLVAQRN